MLDTLKHWLTYNMDNATILYVTNVLNIIGLLDYEPQ